MSTFASSHLVVLDIASTFTITNISGDEYLSMGLGCVIGGDVMKCAMWVGALCLALSVQVSANDLDHTTPAAEKNAIERDLEFVDFYRIKKSPERVGRILTTVEESDVEIGFPFIRIRF